MDPSFEQASTFLDQAILSYSGGEIESAAQFMAEAAAVLHEIQLAPPAKLEPEAFQPVATDSAAAIAPELLLTTVRPVEPAALHPVELESAGKSSVAVAA